MENKFSIIILILLFVSLANAGSTVFEIKEKPVCVGSIILHEGENFDLFDYYRLNLKQVVSPNIAQDLSIYKISDNTLLGTIQGQQSSSIIRGFTAEDGTSFQLYLCQVKYDSDSGKRWAEIAVSQPWTLAFQKRNTDSLVISTNDFEGLPVITPQTQDSRRLFYIMKSVSDNSVIAVFAAGGNGNANFYDGRVSDNKRFYFTAVMDSIEHQSLSPGVSFEDTGTSDKGFCKYENGVLAYCRSTGYNTRIETPSNSQPVNNASTITVTMTNNSTTTSQNSNISYSYPDSSNWSGNNTSSNTQETTQVTTTTETSTTSSTATTSSGSTSTTSSVSTTETEEIPMPVAIYAGGDVEITEFGDFECPFCKKFFDDTLPQLKQRYGDKLTIKYKHFPLPFHDYVRKAAEASECARDQGKFLEYHDVLFKYSPQLDEVSLNNYADEIGLDIATFKNCLSNGEKKAIVEADYQEGSNRGVSGTPTFFIGDRVLVGAVPFQSFVDFIEGGQSEKIKDDNYNGQDGSKEETKEKKISDNSDSTEKIVTLLIKLEKLSIKFDRLSTESEGLANYYQGTNDAKYQKWKKVSQDFKDIVTRIDETKQSIKNKDTLDDASVKDINDTLDYIRAQLKTAVIDIVG